MVTGRGPVTECMNPGGRINMFWKTEDGEVDKRCLFLVLLLTGAIVVGGLYICSPFFYGSGEEVPAEESISLESEKEEPELLVYITGAVKYPGVYKVAAGSHVYDVIHEAGDILPYADTASINLTEKVVNHMQIVVKTDLAGQGALADGKVNINTATGKELETLSGVGEATASKIITYRKEHGMFTCKEDLKKVPGIGDGKFKKLEDSITL